MDNRKQLILENVALLAQAETLIGTLSHRLYTNNDGLPPFNSGVGMHIQHIIDFYGAFLAAQNGAIDYDRRERSTEVENSREAGLRAIRTVSEALEEIDDMDLVVMSRNDGGARGDDQGGFSRTTIDRELQFLLSHTVHHYAMIAMILANQAFRPPEGLGVAPSTLAYWRAQKAKY